MLLVQCGMHRFLPFQCPPAALLPAISGRPAEAPVDSPGFPGSVQACHPTSRFSLGSREQQSAAGEVIDARIIGQRHRPGAKRVIDAAFESHPLDLPYPVPARPAIDVMMAALRAPLTPCAAPSPFGKGVGDEDYFAGVGERLEDVRNIFFPDVLQKLAGPDQIILPLGNERAFAEIVLDHMIGNDAILDRLRAAVDSQDLAAQIVKELGRVPLATTDIEYGLNLKFLDDPRPEMRTAGTRIAAMNVAAQVTVLDHLQFRHGIPIQ